MKTLTLLLLSALAAVAQVQVAWDANPEPDVAGYRIHYGTAPGAYTTIIDVGNVTQTTIPNLSPDVTYYSAVTAYNTSDLESGFSNEIIFSLTPPGPPKNYRIVVEVQTSSNLTDWEPLAAHEIEADAQRFFRFDVRAEP